MATYLCKPDELRADAKTLRDGVAKLRGITANLNSCITSLGSEWMGSAAVAFLNSFNNRKLESVKYLEVINEYADLLEYAASRFEQADKTAGQRIGNA